MQPFPGRKSVGNSLELQRIVGLPRRQVDGAALVEPLTRELKTPKGSWTLRPLQAQALHDMRMQRGFFGPLRVGSGKTLITLLAPLVLQARMPVLVLPASLVSKTEEERRQLSQHWRIPTSTRILSYQMLGRVEHAKDLDFYKPDLLILDECHLAKNKHAGVTRRLVRYFQQYPDTMCVAVSGTVMKNSLKDFAHIARWCLKGNTPLPSTEDELDVWCDAVDEKVNPFQRIDPGALTAFSSGQSSLSAVRKGLQSRILETPGIVGSSGDQVACSLYIQGHTYPVSPDTERHFSRLRNAWELPTGWRLTEAVEMWRHARELALGFHYEFLGDGYEQCQRSVNLIRSKIGNGINSIELLIASSSLSTSEKDECFRIVEKLRRARVSKQGTESPKKSSKPSGQDLIGDAGSASGRHSEGLAAWQSIMTTLPAEFEGFCAPNVIRPSELFMIQSRLLNDFYAICRELCRPPPKWLEARKAWAAFVRDVLSHSRSLDTELQVVNAIDAGKLTRQHEGRELLEEWRAIKPTFTPRTVIIWHDGKPLEWCAKWLEKGAGIVWCEHVMFAEALAKLTGKPYFGANGVDASGRPIESAQGAVIASIAANSTGRNLQKWNRNLLTSVFTNAPQAEQLLGRTHRDGQERDEVTVDLMLGCAEHYSGFERARDAARAQQDMLGHQQKLLLADVVLPPRPCAGDRWLDMRNRDG